jgi:hypothetical protein
MTYCRATNSDTMWHMVKNERNRSQGWQHAKLDGHANEVEFAYNLLTSELYHQILTFLGRDSLEAHPTIEVDGAKYIDSIFGDKTVSKIDLALKWADGGTTGISLKKSRSGQVWLISVPRFISALEFHFKSSISDEVKKGISLFIGGTNLNPFEKMYTSAINSDKIVIPSLATQEIHQSRLLARSMEFNFPEIWNATLSFFNENIELITRLSYAQGLAVSKSEFADLVVYNRESSSKKLFDIENISKAAKQAVEKEKICAGPRNGGSTLLLPTGRLQMHRPQGDNMMQFRHEYLKVSKL